MMGASALTGAILLAALSQTENAIVFRALWIAIGFCMAGCLYEPCFAVVTRALGLAAARAITLITLAAGFASTLAFPAAAEIAGAFGWRAAVAAFALVAAAAAPMLWWGASRLQRRAPPPEPPKPDAPKRQRTLRRPVFWALALSFAVMSLTHGMIISHLLPMLESRGASADAAVLAASMIGPMQVAGRLGIMAVAHRFAPATLCFFSFTGVTLASLVLLSAVGAPSLIGVFVLLQGACWGVSSILKPIVTAAIFGREGFGVVSGMIAMPFFIANAVAPAAGALIWATGGYTLVLALTASLAAIGTATMFGISRGLRA
jgi:predicted MFS family arabinose efflux permease